MSFLIFECVNYFKSNKITFLFKFEFIILLSTSSEPLQCTNLSEPVAYTILFLKQKCNKYIDLLY